MADKVKHEWLRSGFTIYELVQTGWRKGEPIEQNRFTISIQGTRFCEEADLEKVAALVHAAPALLEALKGARAIVAEELDCLIRSCSLDGTAATLDADARDEVARVQASLDKIDAALTLTGART
ncbi:MAG TPA: hypothetical protein VM471_09505 [Phenylobacterium sp.]|jgi:hypothetical protein|nr:hypothetical protein [Phenylobacterium sp.]